MFESTTRYSFPNKYSNIVFIEQDNQSTGSYRFCHLHQNVQSLLQASLSPILTLGPYILHSHPNLQPPRFRCDQPTNGKIDTDYPSRQLSVNNYTEVWNDYLSNLVVEQKVYQQGQTMYFCDLVSTQYFENFAKSDIFYLNGIKKQFLKDLIKQKNFIFILQFLFLLERKEVPKTRKMAAVCFSSTSSVPQRYLPKVHIAGMFFGIFYRSTDTWKIYKPIKGDFPTQEQLGQLDGIVLSGSAFSVYEDNPSVNKFMKTLVNAFKKSKKLNILGFCFGHQSLAYHFGGKVIKMPQQIVHLENIKIDLKKLVQLQLPWIQKNSSFLNGEEDYLVSQFHGDAVVEVPQGFQVIGSSQSCSIQMMASKDKRILSYQFHMQYTPQFAGAYQLRLKSYDQNCEYGKIYDNSSKIQGCDRNLRSILQLRRISRNFLQTSH